MNRHRKDCEPPQPQDLLDELAEIQQLRARQVYRRRRSCLDRYRFEILLLYAHGASYRDLQRLLRRRRVAVSHTTIRNRVLLWQAQEAQVHQVAQQHGLIDFPDGADGEEGDDSPEA